ncbi:unnamed protein product [Schistosoma margrebowiei]|uniref:Uncharacterized protein n=1 Tax=Schistosoma margrebowiei TaxID=48269 RepID=A0A183MJI5_9TREM|nr:unnamed protein product [Schistosoma margrebowiei]
MTRHVCGKGGKKQLNKTYARHTVDTLDLPVVPIQEEVKRQVDLQSRTRSLFKISRFRSEFKTGTPHMTK